MPGMLEPVVSRGWTIPPVLTSIRSSLLISCFVTGHVPFSCGANYPSAPSFLPPKQEPHHSHSTHRQMLLDQPLFIDMPRFVGDDGLLRGRSRDCGTQAVEHE